jgi:hypothetical protein
MDASGGRATLGAARLENGHCFDRPEIKTDRASHTQAKGDLEQNGQLVERLKAKRR